MKKVRFVSPVKGFVPTKMSDTECHSPRPFIERHLPTMPTQYCTIPRVLPYSTDPIQKFESSNSSPYPIVNKTKISSENRPNWSPSNDLDLSMLEASYHEPRRPVFSKSILKTAENNASHMTMEKKTQVLSSIENTPMPPMPIPNVLSDNDFFIKRGNLNKLHLDTNPVQTHLKRLSLDKENDPSAKKAEMAQNFKANENNEFDSPLPSSNMLDNVCASHHCSNISPPVMIHTNRILNKYQIDRNHTACYNPNYLKPHHKNNNCHCMVPQANICACCENTLPRNHYPKLCSCSPSGQHTSPKINAVDKKTLAIQKYEQKKQGNSMEVEKQIDVVKEKREPTVTDLFKIIKLQNEQLQLLQEKVDKFILSTQKQTSPSKNCTTEHVAIETIDSEQHKISIGVMTSFEMVRTSTIINKEVVKSTDTQIQCNRSQISIKEVVSKSPNVNFLDGIAHVGNRPMEVQKNRNVATNMKSLCDGNEEKTFNELSLYNVQVDNATTPLMSPDQTLYLDLRDYSDSDADSYNQSNVGWTYYNKVMSHVNGMLQDSDMPSSASALYRNTRQQMQTVQMHFDKTNVSVTKRVKFGDDPIGVQPPQATTDTSLKMNQLAAKYLKSGPPPAAPERPAPRPTGPMDMSFATRNYMERHKLLQGVPSSSRAPQPSEMPRFLDITALKQQPKFL